MSILCIYVQAHELNAEIMRCATSLRSIVDSYHVTVVFPFPH